MRRFLTLVALSLFSLPALHAETATELAERFALADDREVVVASLVPGTDEHFHYRALLWQHQGKLAEVDALMPRWEELHPESPHRERIHLRQAVLWVDRDAVVGAQRLADAAELDLEISAVPAPAQAQRLPSVLDPRFYAPEALIAKAEANGRIDGWSDIGLLQRVANLKDATQRRAALERIVDRNIPGVLDLVLADLAAPGGDFGSSPLHNNLTRAQLDALRAARPSLVEDIDFLVASIQVRRSRMDLDRFAVDDALRQTWIAELQEFAAPLPAIAGQLQAFVALHHLREQVQAGRVTMPAVAAVLARPLVAAAEDGPGKVDEKTGKPRELPPGNRLLLATKLEPVEAPTELIDEAITAVFLVAPDISGLAGLRDEEQLRQHFITAKLLSGVGEAATWLTRPDDVALGRALQERVELRFAHQAPSRLVGDAQVVLPLVLKQVPTLRVRIFALDAVNLYRQNGAEPRTDLDLAGVVPTHERLLTFAQPSIIRHRHALALPECAAPGLWLVELIGGNQVARALVRKGALSFSRTTQADGEHLHVIDEADRPVPDAAVWIGDQRFSAGADGSVRLPFVLERRTDTLVLSGGGRTALVKHDRRKEEWSLYPGVLLEREQLIAGGQATVLLRPRLHLSGQDMPFSQARDLRVEITTTTSLGMRRVTTVVPQGDPAQAEWRVAFPCDEGVISVQVRLSALVRNRSRNQDESLSGERATEVNGELRTGRLYDAYLESGVAGWSLALLGRAGEPLADEPLELALSHRLLNDPLIVQLATDATGRVHLGSLDDFVQVRWLPPKLARYGYDGVPTSPRHLERRWNLHHHVELPAEITIHAGETLRLPVIRGRGIKDEIKWSVWRGDWEHAGEDVSSLARIEDEHGVPVLVVPALPAGRYSVRTPGDWTPVRVIAGTRQGTLVLAAGAIHRLDSPAPLRVAVLPQGDGMLIQVVGRTPSTRVHVSGLRFHPVQVASFSGPRFEPQSRWPRPWPAADYQQGRPLDPELGYILARADAPRLPGVMLERPGLILNPWVDDSSADIGTAKTDADMLGARNGGGRRRSVSAGGGMPMSDLASGRNTVMDFLSGPGVTLANLVPDANGAVLLTAAQLGDSRALVVQVCDATQDISVLTTLPRTDLAVRERRLMTGLPVDQHLVVQRRVQVIPAGGRASVRRSALDRSRLCATVQDLLRLHQALDPDLDLHEFDALGSWATLDEAARRRWYSAHACHEVHLFLWHKDRRFFDAVVRPYLANKLQPDFIDQWLLERDLTPWLAADRHRTLNLCERILLARRLGGEAGAQEFASLQADVFGDLADEQSDLGERIAAILVAHGEGTVVGRVPVEPDVELPPMKVTTVDREADENQMEKMDINAPIQDYRDHAKPALVIEQQWYRVPGKHDDASGLFTASGFWRDFAAWDGQTKFLPAGCLLARYNNEVLVTLALCDLPLTAAEPQWSETPDSRQVEVATPALLFSEEIVPQPIQAGAVVVQQRHHLAEALRIHGDQAAVHTGAFTPGTAYVTRTVVLNPTPQPITIALLAQIPTGAVPLSGAPATAIGEMVIDSYEHTQIDHAFYFPQAGEFQQYPTHIHAGAGVYAAVSEPRCVVGGATVPTVGGAQATPAERLLDQLATGSRHEIDLDTLRWRFTDAFFWRACVAILERRRWYEDSVWSASLLHRDTARMAVWLRSQPELIKRLGNTVHSAWLTIEALDDGGVLHADITPLTIARAHRRASAAVDLPQPVVDRWQSLLERLCLVPRLAARDRLEVAYTLTLQDRLAEASVQFGRLKRDDLAARLQYDYLGAYLALARGDLAAAARFAASGKDHPVAHWRLRFGEVLAQLDEIAGRLVTREQALGEARRQDVQAAGAPTFQARLQDGGMLAISATALERCTVRWHRLALEPLFSQAPFATANAARSTRVRAPLEQEVAFPASGQAAIAMPVALQHQAVVIEVVAAGRSQVLTTFADALDVRLAPGSGQLQVFHATTGKVLPATYVKVYGELPDGRVVFHKDGYTDLRGRFDYASLGDGSVRASKRLALFISHDEAGATVREVSPP